jgi:hypothetical protein
LQYSIRRVSSDFHDTTVGDDGLASDFEHCGVSSDGLDGGEKDEVDANLELLALWMEE